MIVVGLASWCRNVHLPRRRTVTWFVFLATRLIVSERNDGKYPGSDYPTGTCKPMLDSLLAIVSSNCSVTLSSRASGHFPASQKAGRKPAQHVLRSDATSQSGFEWCPCYPSYLPLPCASMLGSIRNAPDNLHLTNKGIWPSK